MYIYGLSSKGHMKRHCVSSEKRHRHCWKLLMLEITRCIIIHFVSFQWNQYIKSIQICYIFYSYSPTDMLHVYFLHIKYI